MFAFPVLATLSGFDVRSGFDVLFTGAVPEGRRPTPMDETIHMHCGPSVRGVEQTFEGQRFPWGLFVQHGHYVIFVVTTHDRSHVVVVRQWRPTDSDSIELPGGNANKLQEAFREELLHEAGVGLDAVEEVTAYCPFVHEVARKAHIDGGACSAYVVHVRLCEGIDLTTHEFQDADTDERGKATWITREHARELVRSGRLADAVTVLALMATGVLN